MVKVQHPGIDAAQSLGRIVGNEVLHVTPEFGHIPDMKCRHRQGDDGAAKKGSITSQRQQGEQKEPRIELHSGGQRQGTSTGFRIGLAHSYNQ